MIVAADGSGDFTTVQEAINAIPADREEQVTIYIKNGVYKEKLHIEKPRIKLLGEELDKTIITFDDYAKKQYSNGEYYNTFHSYSVFIGADDVQAEHLTFVNTAGRGDAVGQALAAYVDGDRVVFRNCRFLGHQDTIFTGPLPPTPVERSTFGGPREGVPRRNGRQYYENCYIEGDVDFIFGSATAVFNRCEIFSKNRLTEEERNSSNWNVVNGWITAASTPEEVQFGYVFLDCRLTGDAPPQSVYLGRPWRDYAKTAFLHCWMGEQIKPEGWHNWGKTEREQTTYFCEYRSTGPGAAMDKRVSWSTLLTDDEAQAFSISNVLSAMDGWNPE